MAGIVRVNKNVLETLRAEARRDPQFECCGLLAGNGGVISVVLPARNELASPTAYSIAPGDLFALFREMRERGLDHLGIYHSHPATDNAPSPSDIGQSYYPEAAYFILSPRDEAPRPIRAFRICDGRSEELEIEAV